MSKDQEYHVAIIGATGAVGRTIMNILEERNFPVRQLSLFASDRSRGQTLGFKEEKHPIKVIEQGAFKDVDIAFFSAGGTISRRFVPQAIDEGAIVIDNTSAFRMDPDVPLIVPEVNEYDIKHHNGLIANPNCSTIQMAAVLYPIREKVGLKRVIVSTYQSISGAGTKAVSDLKDAASSSLKDPHKKDKDGLAFNVIPKIDVFKDKGFTYEEMKMIEETKKILSYPDLQVGATCVRVPVFTSHAESVYIEIDSESKTVQDIQQILREAKGIVVEDAPERGVYPTPIRAANEDSVFVGRIRQDLDLPNAFHMWIVSDNLRKGAALNTVQIAESLIKTF
ncbi:aspartate-semialdehyde dehydrogenase [Lentibacillus sp. JNUCC-1]|uniref:aspartate-semialdehyde dehydrogenase n=1 Tax=Lentibacillus sp. JNUCC-1 TaxID=2654513 RepID=UPI0012E7078F|nr:aspartate-semialdehyde dehydrogenase [Lentibacillus sp. JNUCC-1]